MFLDKAMFSTYVITESSIFSWWFNKWATKWINSVNYGREERSFKTPNLCRLIRCQIFSILLSSFSLFGYGIPLSSISSERDIMTYGFHQDLAYGLGKERDILKWAGQFAHERHASIWIWRRYHSLFSSGILRKWITVFFVVWRRRREYAMIHQEVCVYRKSQN